jgi:hypothetical protein
MNFVISKEMKLEQDAVHFYYEENLAVKEARASKVSS